MDIIEILTPHYDAAWLPWAVQYFFLIGMAATAAITAAILSFSAEGSDSRRLLPSAVTVLLVCGIVAPIALLADLHQPGRFWHFYAHFTPWSWMSIGAVLIPIFIALVILFSLFWWMRKDGAMRLIGVLMIFSAASILLYTGSEIMVIRARPLWNTIFLPINFALTGWLAALGAMLFVARWLPGGLAAFPTALWRRYGLFVVLLLVICAAAWIVTGMIGRDPSYPAAVELFATYPTWRLSLYGSLAMAACIVFSLVVGPQRFSHRFYSLVCSVIMMAAAWVFRWIVLMGIQTVPKYGAGLYLHEMPLGSDGLLGMISVFGLCIALLAIITWFLDRYPSSADLQTKSYAANATL